jgi:NAD(P)-dependent dehydrogenase (short-subunit alcohol dehydrogenase family)
VITGAGSGIGRSAALLFAREGATVHVADRDAERAAAVAAKIGPAATAHTVDVTDPVAMESLAEAVYADHATVDIVMNNAGIGHAGPTAETPLSDWRAIVEVNIMGVVHGVHAVVPRLLAQDGPADIVNTASLAGLAPVAKMAPYVMSKHAIVGLSESLHAELSSQGIRVTALCPGVIDTAIVADSTMRGSMADSAHKAVAFYRKRGVSPDVVAHDHEAPPGNHRIAALAGHARVDPPPDLALGGAALRAQRNEDHGRLTTGHRRRASSAAARRSSSVRSPIAPSSAVASSTACGPAASATGRIDPVSISTRTSAGLSPGNASSASASRMLPRRSVSMKPVRRTVSTNSRISSRSSVSGWGCGVRISRLGTGRRSSPLCPIKFRFGGPTLASGRLLAPVLTAVLAES